MVTITDVPSSIVVTKTAIRFASRAGRHRHVLASRSRTRRRSTLTISSLSDDVYGNLDGKGTCDVPQAIAAGQLQLLLPGCGLRQRRQQPHGRRHRLRHRRRRQTGLGRRRRGRHDHERAELDRGDEDGGRSRCLSRAAMRPSRSRSRTPRRSTRSRSRPHRRRLRQPGREGHCDVPQTIAAGQLQLLLPGRGQRQRGQLATRTS